MELAKLVMPLLFPALKLLHPHSVGNDLRHDSLHLFCLKIKMKDFKGFDAVCVHLRKQVYEGLELIWSTNEL
jgi:hypothetical protein